MDENIAQLQISLLALLLFDESKSTLIRNQAALESWLGDAAIIRLVTKVYEYIDMYQRPPKSDIYGLLEEIRLTNDHRENLKEVILRAEIKFEEGINTDYTLARLDNFQIVNTWKTLIQDAIPLLEQGKVDAFMALKDRANRTTLKTFNPAKTLLSVVEDMLNEDESTRENDRVLMGIPELDERLCFPARKRLFTFVAPTSRGKSWFLNYVGRRAITFNKKVMHLSLEMDEREVGTRYVQSLYSLRTQKATGRTRTRIVNKGFDVIQPKDDPLVADSLGDIINKLHRDQYIDKMLRIKEFPTSSISLQMIKGFLDSQEAYDGFIPDVLLLDYADLLSMEEKKDSWDELNSLYKKLRGFAIERNLILVTASQTNKGGILTNNSQDKTEIDERDIQGAFAKLNTCDHVLSFSQTPLERDAGLARLTIMKNRRGETGLTFAISQDYSRGQFILPDSTMDLSLSENRAAYKNMIDTLKAEAVH